MKYLSIVFVAAIALVSCGGEVDACECAAAKAEAGEEAWAADSAANAACNEAMAVEGALDSCEVAAEEVAEEAPAEEAAAEEAPVEEAAPEADSTAVADSTAAVEAPAEEAAE